jgi:membrane protein
LGLFFASEGDLYSRLMAYFRRVMPDSVFELVQGVIRDLTSGASGTKLSLGLLVTIWSASAGVNALIKGLNVAYDVRELRPWYRRRWVAIIITLALAVLVTSALVMLVWGDNIGGWLAARWNLGEWFQIGWSLAHWGVVVGFVLLALNLIYVFGPNLREHRWQAFFPGSIAALALWLLASVGFKAYFESFGTYAKTYGSLGAIIALLVWLYLTGLAILMGGEVNSEIRKAAATAGAAEAQTPIEGPD